MVFFGGRGLGYDVLDDVWVFDVFEGYLMWVYVFFNLQNIFGGVFFLRVGYSVIYILGGGLLIYGGEDFERQRKDDFWLLDVNLIFIIRVDFVSISSVILFISSMILFIRMWRKLEVYGYKFNSRLFYVVCVDDFGCYVFVFGGMVDVLF